MTLRIEFRPEQRCARLARATALGVVAWLAGCGSSFDDSFRLETVTTGHPNDPATPLAVAGRWLVYMASEANEAGGTDLNGDGDTVDAVAVAIDLVDRTETVIGVAAREAAIVGNEIFLVIDEAAQLGAPAVPPLPQPTLAHWRAGQAAPVMVDVVPDRAGPLLFPSGDRLYYASASAPAAPDGTSVRFLEEGAPTSPIEVDAAPGLGALGAQPVELLEGLLVLRLIETVAQPALGDWPVRDLNGDGDQADEVLGLLDATDVGALVQSTGLALPAVAPLDARAVDGDDWLVAFLVNEGAQGAALSAGCGGAAADGIVPAQDVLHFVRYRDLEAGLAPANTGLIAAARVVALSDVVATLADENQLGCDLNGDGDATDLVARFVEAVPPGTPVVATEDPAELLAVNPLAGPSMGLAGLDERVVVVVDEATDGRDHDGDGVNRSLVASRDPLDPDETGFVFEHRSGVVEFDATDEVFRTVQPFVGASWMGERPAFGRLAVACEEAVAGVPLNRNDFCDDVQKDADLVDVVPVWPRVRSLAERNALEPEAALTFPGVGYALDAANPGLVLAGRFALVRVSEAADARDYNEDGDQGDVVLFASTVVGCNIAFMGDSTAALEPVATSDGLVGAAFRSDESQAGIDLDGDGDAADIVVQYFRF